MLDFIVIFLNHSGSLALIFLCIAGFIYSNEGNKTAIKVLLILTAGFSIIFIACFIIPLVSILLFYVV